MRSSTLSFTLPILVSLLTPVYSIPFESTPNFNPLLVRLYTDPHHRGDSVLPRSHTKQPLNPQSAARWVEPPQNVILPTTGNIRMKSSQKHEIPFSFSLSSNTCTALAAECTCLIDDLAKRMVDQHPIGVHMSKQCGFPTMVTETVDFRMGGRLFRASLEMKLKGKKAGGRIGQTEFGHLVNLLRRTVAEIESEGRKRGGSGLGTVLVLGHIEGLDVEALWTFYEFSRGIVERCH